MAKTQPDNGIEMKGVMLMIGSSLAFSTIGVFSVGIDLPLAEMLLIRGLFGAMSIWIFARLFTRERIFSRVSFTWPALSVAGLFVVGMTSLVAAYRFGSVVSVSIIYGTAPLMVAAMSFVLLRERPKRVLVLCGIIALTGIWASTGAVPDVQDIIGMSLAFLMTMCVGGIMLIAQKYPATPMLGGSLLASVISSLLVLPFVESLVIAPREFVLCAIFGIITLGLGRAFLVLGAQRLPSNLASLIDVLDAPLTPVWVFLILGMVPATHEIFGSIITIGAVLYGIYATQFGRMA